MKKSITAICIILILVLLFALSACKIDDSFVNPGDNLGGGGIGDIADNVDTSQTEDGIDKVITDIDTDGAQAGQIPDDAEIPDAIDNVITITRSGAYTISGNYSQIVIDGSGLNVQLILNGATIDNSNGVAIDGTSKGKKLTVTLTVVEGKVNTITNNGDSVNAVHIKGSLTVNGAGNLTVNSAGKSALKASKGIIITQANLSLTAVNHAITGANVTATNCTINVASAGKDGINAECDDDITEYVADDGYVYLKNVNYTCNVNGDGIQADTWLYVEGGSYAITTDGTFVANTSANMQKYGMTNDDFRYAKSGNTYKKLASDETNRYSTRYGLVQSAKGFKVGEIDYTDETTNQEVTVTDGDYCIKIVSGNITLNCSDDAIHTNSGDVIIS
ncbi:MAG: carbohydrate-binding domain-containing protein, partial [Clostridia bacterium]|nr:carbohydrate-binding domain-containing protein [Clostridia bacterium]